MFSSIKIFLAHSPRTNYFFIGGAWTAVIAMLRMMLPVDLWLPTALSLPVFVFIFKYRDQDPWDLLINLGVAAVGGLFGAILFALVWIVMKITGFNVPPLP